MEILAVGITISQLAEKHKGEDPTFDFILEKLSIKVEVKDSVLPNGSFGKEINGHSYSRNATETWEDALGRNLFSAVQDQDVDRVKTLIADGANPNSNDWISKKIMADVGNKANLEMFKLLYDAGLSLDNYVYGPSDGEPGITISQLAEKHKGEDSTFDFILEKLSANVEVHKVPSIEAINRKRGVESNQTTLKHSVGMNIR